MKKIIAAAVATAFVAPAFAADITVGGAMEYAYKDVSSSTTTTKTLAEDTTVAIKASTELDNGITVSGDFTISQAYAGDGSSLDISGEFGKIALGDSAGAVDSLDGGVSIDKVVTVNSYESTDSFDGFNADVAFRWDLPAIVPGLGVAVTHTPENGGPTGTTSDVNGVLLTYSAGNISVGYAQEEQGTTEYSGGVVSGTFGPISASYETWDKDVAGSSSVSLNAITAVYTMGDMTLAARQADVKDGSTVNSDVSSFFAQYSLGSGVTLFAETSSEGKLTTNDEETAVGIVYAF